MGVVDDLERPVVLAALAGHEEDVDGPRLQRPHRVVDTVGDPDQLEARVVRHRTLDVEGVETLDGDQRADERVRHSTT